MISEGADRSGGVGLGWDVHTQHDNGSKLSRQVKRLTLYDKSLKFRGASCRQNCSAAYIHLRLVSIM